MPEFNLMVKALDGLGVGGLLDGVLRHQDLIDALHRGESLGDVITCLGEVLQRIDDGIEHHHIIYEDRARERVVVQYQHTTEPQHDDNHHRT